MLEPVAGLCSSGVCRKDSSSFKKTAAALPLQGALPARFRALLGLLGRCSAVKRADSGAWSQHQTPGCTMQTLLPS